MHDCMISEWSRLTWPEAQVAGRAMLMDESTADVGLRMHALAVHVGGLIS